MEQGSRKIWAENMLNDIKYMLGEQQTYSKTYQHTSKRVSNPVGSIVDSSKHCWDW